MHVLYGDCKVATLMQFQVPFSMETRLKRIESKIAREAASKTQNTSKAQNTYNTQYTFLYTN